MKRSSVLRLAVVLFCMAFVAGIYTFVVIPSVREEERASYRSAYEDRSKRYKNVLTYMGDTPLLAGTVITDAVSRYFSSVEMPIECFVPDYAAEFEDIVGLQAEYTICSGQPVSFQCFRKFLIGADGDERLKEFEICSLVAGQAMPGRFADILLCYPSGSTAVVVPKIQIYDIQEYSGDSGYTTDGERYTVVFAVNDEEYTNLMSARREGVLDIRIYLDETQMPSVKTYNPIHVPVISGG